MQWRRDTEDSAPAEYPPEQPEADTVEEDGTSYGAEEIELEEMLKKEVAEAKIDGEDEEMAGAGDTAGPSNAGAEVEDDESDAGSEDLEAESSGSEDEEEEEEVEGEGEGDEDMEMGEDGAKPVEPVKENQQPLNGQRHGELMVH